MPEQWLPSASNQEDRLPINEDVPRAYIDGRNDGRRDERARIRRELRQEIRLSLSGQKAVAGGGVSEALEIAERTVFAALDRVCPDGSDEGTLGAATKGKD